MGEIKTIVDGDLTYRKVSGIITVKQLLNALEEFYSGNPTKNKVWDFTEASAELIKLEDIEHISDFVQYNSHSRVGGKTAIVVSGNLEFGIARMFDAYADIREVKFDVAVFRELSEAAKWIGVDAFPEIE